MHQLPNSQLERLCAFIREDYGDDLSYDAFAEYLLLMLEDVPMEPSKTVPEEAVLVEQGYRLYTQQVSSGEPTNDA